MTDRIKGLTVVLDKDYREDDVEVIIQAISLLRGVQQVIPRESGHEDIMTEMRVKQKLKSEILDYIFKL